MARGGKLTTEGRGELYRRGRICRASEERERIKEKLTVNEVKQEWQREQLL